ncbi:MAG: ABC transporter ATP-binding protein [Acidimicrobiales bacterium]|nr:ABC transporter ATP-binding protein [Acidimicrobiales bacterium]MDP6298167.1 ABC transporter ATP-binding protein [Acidimicrobiales bacterium]HJM28340.1 ABC transporter ATP-binding protein [Acidimicrobiales bacterium]HJM98116.1 ABC transporter ATP-binding protein [Acidimicrobiales bacterium]
MDSTAPKNETLHDRHLRRGLELVKRSLKIRPMSHAIAITGACLFSISAVALTRILGFATDEVIIPNLDRGISENRNLWVAVSLIIAVGVSRGLGAFLRRYFLAGARYGTELVWRRQLFNQYLDLPMSFHRSKSPGELLAHADNDMMIASLALMPLAFTVGTFFLSIIALVNLFLIHPIIALLALVLFPLLAGMNQIYSRKVVSPAAAVQDAVGNTSAMVHESFDGIMVLKSLGRSEEEIQRLRQSANQIRNHRITVGRLRAIFEPLIYALPNFGVIGLLMVGTWLIDRGSLTIGDLVSAIALFGILAFPMRIVGIFFEELPRSVVALDRIDKILDLPVQTKPPTGNKEIGDLSGSIEVKNLEASYEEQLVLNKINFRIDQGEVVALVGPTGVGKSTIADLISGLQKPTSGEISLHGIPLESINQKQQNEILAVAFQESFLFADTVRENIVLDRDFNEAQVLHAIEAAQATDFINDLPDGIDTILGERGITLSGGQRQRITLARALVGNPKILFLDDSTSSVDPIIEKKILENLRMNSDVTLLIVAHRLSTIKLADRVIFLNQGKIEGTGTHEEMMNINAYAALAKAYEINETTQ